jgi:hypothetical protein
MVVLEPMALGTPPAMSVHKAAAVLIADIDSTPKRSRQVSRLRVLRDVLPPRPRRLGKPSGFQPLELLRDRLFQDPREVAVREPGARQCPETFQLVAEGRARRELDLVSSGRQDLDAGWGA